MDGHARSKQFMLSVARKRTEKQSVFFFFKKTALKDRLFQRCAHCLLFYYYTRLQKAHVQKSSFKLVWQGFSVKKRKSYDSIIVPRSDLIWGKRAFASLRIFLPDGIAVGHDLMRATGHLKKKKRLLHSLHTTGILWNPVAESRTRAKNFVDHSEALGNSRYFELHIRFLRLRINAIVFRRVP